MTFHNAVRAFKRDLLVATLIEHGGSRTRAARALGLQRTYLIRLIGEYGIDVAPWCSACARTRDTGRCVNHREVAVA